MNEKQFTLGVDYDGEKVSGWFCSEKMDGCRAYWDGETLWTRGGNKITAPAWLIAGLPTDHHLDGEIFAGRDNLQSARLAVQNNFWTEGTHTFEVFDCPTASGNYSERMHQADALVADCPCAQVVKFSIVKNLPEVFAALQKVHARKGEGLMLRNPKVTTYETGRTKNLLKVKAAHPAMFL